MGKCERKGNECTRSDSNGGNGGNAQTLRDFQGYASCLPGGSSSSLDVDSACNYLTQTFASTVTQVSKFYENKELVMRGCKGAVLFPSECAVDLFSKDVSFLFGGLTNAGVDIGYGGVKTSSFVKKGFPAASRLDRMMNF